MAKPKYKVGKRGFVLLIINSEPVIHEVVITWMNTKELFVKADKFAIRIRRRKFFPTLEKLFKHLSTTAIPYTKD